MVSKNVWFIFKIEIKIKQKNILKKWARDGGKEIRFKENKVIQNF